MINNPFKIKILVNYKYKNIQIYSEVEKLTTLKELKESFETSINFSLNKFKLLYLNNNILLINENYKVYDFFGDVKEIILEIKPHDSCEVSYLERFERIIKEFNGKSIYVNSNNDNVNSKGDKVKKDNNEIIRNEFVDLCNYDKKNLATYICTSCRLFWCRNCIKFEAHTSNLVELKGVEVYTKMSREKYLKDIEEKVINDDNYSNLEKIDILLNSHIDIINKQFNEMVEILNSIKEQQTKFIIDYYYQQVDNKTFKSINNDIQYFKIKVKDIDQNYKIHKIDENLNNNEVIEKYKNIIIQNYDEFKYKYTNFKNISIQYEEFNTAFVSQLEAKMKQSNLIRSKLNDPIKLNKEIQENAIQKESIKFPILLKMKYYNSILVWDHLKQNIKKITDFKDRFDFKINYQVYCGNIYLNHMNRLFIVTGKEFNMFYFYDMDQNEIYQLPSLINNHCRGSMLYVERLKSILCLSGKYTNKCEIFDMTNFNFPCNQIIEKEIKLDENIIKPEKKKPEPFFKKRTDKPRSSKLLVSIINKLPNKDDEDMKNSKYSNNTEVQKGFFKKKIDIIKENIKVDDLKNSSQIESNMNDLNYLKLYKGWKELPNLNNQRNSSCFYCFDKYLYCFFGYNSGKGPLDTIERLDVEKLDKWDLINYRNEKMLNLKIDSQAIIYANNEEVIILGGSIKNKYSDRIFKYNFMSDAIFLTEMKIPGLIENEYYRFWEESNFKAMKNLDVNFSNEDDYTFAMFDAKDKVHIFNSRNFKYNII